MVSEVRQSNVKGTGLAPVRRDDARIILDEDGNVLYTTEAFAELVEKSQKSVKGTFVTSLFDFEEPDESIRDQNLFAEGARKKFIDTIPEGTHKVSLYGKNGASKALIRFDKVKGRDGKNFLIGSKVNKVNASGINDQVAERILHFLKQAETSPPAKQTVSSARRIREDQDELRQFLNMSNDIMAISTLNGKFSRVNSSFNALLGYADTELRELSFMDLIYEDDKPHIRPLITQLLHDDFTDDTIIDFEARIVTCDGSVRWFEWRQKRQGKYIYSVGRDVTDAKCHERALQQQEQMLSEAQAIGHMGHWYWAVGAESIDWSDEIYRIFGVDKKNFRPTLDDLNAMLHKRDLGRLMQAFQRAIIEQNNYDMEFRINRPDGETRYIRCEGKCKLDEEGDVIALFGVMQDITDTTLHEKELREAKDAAERAYAAKSQFLANMSHELRTPLNAIIGFSEMMQRQLLGPLGNEKYLDYITGIRESGEHLLDLISDILDMSKIEAGKYELDLEELNAGKIIQLAVHMMEGKAQDANIKVTAEAADENLQLIADRRAFMQILLNLLSNAVKFTNPKGQVKISCQGRDNYVSIKVSDTGIGIPATKLKAITRPFEQAASHYTREHEGSGLGLAITKDLIEMHGGSLHIDSVVDVGTTVTVRLPYNAYEYVKKQKEEAGQNRAAAQN